MQARWAILMSGVIVAALVLVPWLTPPPGPPTSRCAGCHEDVREPGHPNLGCEGCHLGIASSERPELAHLGLVRLPGQLADAARTCGAAGCHPDLPARLANNVMTTMNGVVSVDRFVFGEQSTPTAVTPIATLGHGPADSHLRNLCASCHLGTPKLAPGPIDARTRGGGCLACHLAYDPRALGDLEQRDGGHLRAHPSLTWKVESVACLGCHARSGRISLNYEGWLDVGDADAGPGARTLADGRHLAQMSPDVHARAGLGCVDCHGAAEVMGHGARALHREDQRLIACEDCHLAGERPGVTSRSIDPLSERLLHRLRLPAATVVRARRGEVPLPGLQWLDGGVTVLVRSQGTSRSSPRQAPACAREGPHQRLSCQSCHDAWTPTCVSCHTSYDDAGVMFDLLSRAEAPGAWEEVGGPGEALPPTLGETEDGGIVTVAPGMILTIEHAGRRTFRRLFAPVASHTTSQARSCESCHQNPAALGFGRGRLRFVEARDRLVIRLEPELAPGPDGLPQDAWITPFADAGASTREWLTPLRPSTQRRVLRVGACLTCHGSDPTPLLAGQPPTRQCRDIL